ncbi:unnamed protein product (macronuclear) [Paramecium tetraurelia]|uniref:Uncharacterized protein n=1 Tax=Paramecium tetraurelia TaxID=5888 RepID=A0CS79_PARTE|nr:uncharacterized protein GSPATT00009918001 [Paramecium tetraurelia]CAK73646.1 unnamed protein product [Paramecium tetraurelia]|eukprot:XP_001441043.1 hypothetical protein (macronuclear) [Paramecium tetraurelia strain d4-2]
MSKQQQNGVKNVNGQELQTMNNSKPDQNHQVKINRIDQGNDEFLKQKLINMNQLSLQPSAQKQSKEVNGQGSQTKSVQQNCENQGSDQNESTNAGTNSNFQFMSENDKIQQAKSKLEEEKEKSENYKSLYHPSSYLQVPQHAHQISQNLKEEGSEKAITNDKDINQTFQKSEKDQIDQVQINAKEQYGQKFVEKKNESGAFNSLNFPQLSNATNLVIAQVTQEKQISDFNEQNSGSTELSSNYENVEKDNQPGNADQKQNRQQDSQNNNQPNQQGQNQEIYQNQNKFLENNTNYVSVLPQKNGFMQENPKQDAEETTKREEEDTLIQESNNQEPKISSNNNTYRDLLTFQQALCIQLKEMIKQAKQDPTKKIYYNKKGLNHPQQQDKLYEKELLEFFEGWISYTEISEDSEIKYRGSIDFEKECLNSFIEFVNDKKNSELQKLKLLFQDEGTLNNWKNIMDQLQINDIQFFVMLCAIKQNEPQNEFAKCYLEWWFQWNPSSVFTKKNYI